MPSAGFQVQGSIFHVPGSGFLVSSAGCLLASGFLEVCPNGGINTETDTFPPVAHKGYVAAVFLDSDVGFIWAFFSEVQNVGLRGRKNHIWTG